MTIFSASDYCGEFDNDGAVMCVDETLMCSFKKIKPEKVKKMTTGKKMGSGAGTPGLYGKRGSKYGK